MIERPLTELEDEITQGAARIDAAMCAWLLLVAEFDRRAGFESWECRSTAHFLNWRCGISLRTGRDHVRVARRLEELPLVRAAFAEGTLSYSKTRAIVRVATPETEAQLVEWAHCATAAQIERVAAGRRSVDRSAGDARYVTWGYDDDGSFVLRARLTPEDGALVLAALRSARDALGGQGDVVLESGSAEPLCEPDALKPTAADALVAMAETTLAHGPTPVAGGDRHMVLVHVNAATGTATLDDGPELTDNEAGAVLCDAAQATILFGGEGEPLAMGRKTRDPTVAQRRALLARDGGCRFPGCTQRVFVDAHHVQEWEHGGPTDIDNLVLLCRVHHRAIHHRGYTCQPAPHQRFHFYNPQGIRLLPVPPPVRADGDIPTVGASGEAITPDTPVPHWDGHHPDYATAIEGLLILEAEHRPDEQAVA
ncbi:MAG: hypothetical protein QOJ00_460 [Actinomycetota bacterium]